MTTSESEHRTKLRDKGQVTVPNVVRKALNVSVGDELEFEVVGPGKVVVRGLKMIPADQAWFWTETWQRGEREASADIAAGRTRVFKDATDFLDALDR